MVRASFPSSLSRCRHRCTRSVVSAIPAPPVVGFRNSTETFLLSYLSMVREVRILGSLDRSGVVTVTHTIFGLCGAVVVGGESARAFGVTQWHTGSILTHYNC